MGVRPKASSKMKTVKRVIILMSRGLLLLWRIEDGKSETENCTN